MSSQVVRSPGRIKVEIADMTKALEDRRGACEDSERELILSRKRVRCAAEAERNVNRAISLLDELEEGISGHGKVVAEKAGVLETTMANREEILGSYCGRNSAKAISV